MHLRSLLALPLVVISIIVLVGCGPPYDARLVDPSGSPLHATKAQGVEVHTGHSGDTYVLEVRNRTGGYVAAMVAIDGLDRVTGRPVLDDGSDRLYRSYQILPPYSYMELRGFAVGRSRTSTFRFTEPEQAFATRQGEPGGMGRIDVRFYPLVRASTPAPPPRALTPTSAAAIAHPSAEADESGYVKAPPGPRPPDGVFGAVVEEHWEASVGDRYEIAANAPLLGQIVLAYVSRDGAKLGTAGPPPSAEATAAEKPVATNSRSAPEDEEDGAQTSPTSVGKAPPKTSRGPKPSKPSKASKGDVAPVKALKATKAPKPSSTAGASADAER